MSQCFPSQFLPFPPPFMSRLWIFLIATRSSLFSLAQLRASLPFFLKSKIKASCLASLRFLLVSQEYCNQLTQLWRLKIRENSVKVSQRYKKQGLLGGPVVKNPPSNARDMVSILVREQQSHMPRGNSAGAPQLEKA